MQQSENRQTLVAFHLQTLRLKRLEKIVFIPFTILLLLVGQTLYAQNLSQPITIEANKKPLGKVLEEISSKTGISFSYSESAIPIKTKVSIKAKQKPVSKVLDELLIPLNINYLVTENQVVLKPAKLLPTLEKPQPTLKRYTISGYLYDKKTGEVIIGANIYDQSSHQGATTNAYGFYSLSLIEGKYALVISMIGYQQEQIQLDLRKNITLSTELDIKALEMPAVEIVDGSKNALMTPVAGGEVKMSATSMGKMPAFAGNVDVIKTLTNMPGFNSYGDGSAFYYVRGGNNDQNLLLIDEAPIFNPSHLFGFFSALAPDAINEVKAYKGDFPASYGGRLSSVIDVKAREGNMKKHSFSGNIGPFTTDFSIEGPFKKDKSSFIVSARRSNLNWLIPNKGNGKEMKINFYDLNFKSNIRINDKNRLYITGFRGNDELSKTSSNSIQTFGISWQNGTGSLRWNHIFNNKLFSNTTFSYSRYNYYLYTSRELDDYWNSAIANGTIKTDFSYYPNPKNTLKAGLELSNYKSNPGNMHFGINQPITNTPIIPQYQSLSLTAYANNEQKIGQKLEIHYGIRLTSWRDYGPTTVFFFDPNYTVIDTAIVAPKTIYSTFINPEPRIRLNYKAWANTNFYASYNRTVQYLQMLSNSTSPFTSLEVWVPSGPNIKPQKADQYLLGMNQQFPNRSLSLITEFFYRKLSNQIDYKEHANMLYNPLIEGELRFGTTTSKGVEIMLLKNEGVLTGWVAYTYSKTSKTTIGVNNNNTYSPYYDRPHTVRAILAYQITGRLKGAVAWLFQSGAPITTPTGFYTYNGYTVPIFGAKNNSRLPDYHRMDITISYNLTKPEKRFSQQIILSVYNAYGRRNPFALSFNKMMDDNGNFYIPSNLDGNYEIVPTSISVAGAIPSINYVIKF